MGLSIYRCFRPLTPNGRFGGKGAVMTTTLDDVTKRGKPAVMMPCGTISCDHFSRGTYPQAA